MSKSKPLGKPTPPRRLVEQTHRAIALLKSGHPDEALLILEELDKDYPNTPEVLGNLVNVYKEIGDLQLHEYAIWRLSRIETGNADLQFGLASAYLVNQRPSLALSTFRNATWRWTGHQETPAALEIIKDLEIALKEPANEVNLPLD